MAKKLAKLVPPFDLNSLLPLPVTGHGVKELTTSLDRGLRDSVNVLNGPLMHYLESAEAVKSKQVAAGRKRRGRRSLAPFDAVVRKLASELGVEGRGWRVRMQRALFNETRIAFDRGTIAKYVRENNIS